MAYLNPFKKKTQKQDHVKGHNDTNVTECEVHISIFLYGNVKGYMQKWLADNTTVHFSLPQNFNGDIIDNQVKIKIANKLKEYEEEYSKEGFKPMTLSDADTFEYKKLTTFVCSIKIFDAIKKKWNDLYTNMTAYELI